LPEPQGVILPEPSENAIFMVLRVRDAAGSAQPVAKIVARTPALTARLAALDRRAKLVSAVGIGSDFWDVSEAGLFFIAYCRTLDIPQRMLERMMGVGGDSLHDHLMDFTRAISGATFFAPSLRMLSLLTGRGNR